MRNQVKKKNKKIFKLQQSADNPVEDLTISDWKLVLGMNEIKPR